MKAISLLKVLDVGNSVAEFDTHLQAYFLETQIYSERLAPLSVGVFYAGL
jgi:hypothetical protein